MAELSPDQVIGAVARLVLWIRGDLEPLEQKFVEDDLDLLYAVAVAAERLARDKYPDWS